jgi:N6-adenosine-specific RNA methylase IME4/ParB-like chromosome segregation protein Spo0J
MLSSQEAVAELKIDPEFQGLIPPLSQQELEGLERSLCEEGCRDPIVAWEGIIVDGHHRYRLCRKHTIPFKVVEKDFQNRDDAKIWIIENQFARRNVTDFTRCILALEVEPLLAAQARERQREAGRRKLPQKHASPHSEAGETRDAVARLAGVSHDTIRKAKLILEKASEEEKAELSRSDSKLTIHQVYRRLRQEQLRTPTPPLPGDKYELIYCDPPWRYAFTQFESRAIESHYPTMTFEELSALPVPSIAADDCVLFMWAPSCKLEEALRLIADWGFTYRSCAVWVKCRLSFGYYFRNEHELLLLSTKGSPPTPWPENRPPSVIVAPRTQHSKKPDLVYEVLERMYPGLRKIELFARECRKGWAVWGNQVPPAPVSAPGLTIS